MFVKQPSLNFRRKIEKIRFCLFEFRTNESLWRKDAILDLESWVSITYSKVQSGCQKDGEKIENLVSDWIE